MGVEPRSSVPETNVLSIELQEQVSVFCNNEGWCEGSNAIALIFFLNGVDKRILFVEIESQLRQATPYLACPLRLSLKLKLKQQNKHEYIY